MSVSRYFKNHTIVFMIVILLVLVIYTSSANLFLCSDFLFAIALYYLSTGLYRFVRRIRGYNLLIYGTKKTMELIKNKNYTKEASVVGEYVDYVDLYTKPSIKMISIGLFYGLISYMIV